MPRIARTKLTVTDIQTSVGHTNEKGLYIAGQMIIAIRVEYKRWKWLKAYRIIEDDLKAFNMDEFKKRIYAESRIWIKEKEFQEATLKKLKNIKGEQIFLD